MKLVVNISLWVGSVKFILSEIQRVGLWERGETHTHTHTGGKDFCMRERERESECANVVERWNKVELCVM